MNKGLVRKLSGRARRRARVRKKITGSTEIPRLSVFRSAKHIYAQVIDDRNGNTLVSASTLHKSVRDDATGNKQERAQAVGKALAEACKQRDIEKVVFDRSGYRFHGRIKAVAQAARDGGLRF